MTQDNSSAQLVERLRSCARMIEGWATQDERPTLTGFGLNLLFGSVSDAADAIEALTRVQPSTGLDTVDDGRGTFACPICGLDKPHSHTEQEIKFRPDQVQFRLEKLLDALNHKVGGFYNAMCRAYGTDYGPKAEDALKAELKIVIGKLASISPETHQGDSTK